MIVLPSVIKPEHLVNANVAAIPLWDANISYALDARVVQADIEYRSLVAGNKGHSPDTSPVHWYGIGTTNRLAAFDSSPSSQCIGPAGAPLVLQLDTGMRCTSLGVLNASAASLHVHSVDQGSGEVLNDETYTLAASRGTYWSWCFESLQRIRNLYVPGLVPSTRALVTLTFEPLFGTAAVGVVVLGREEFIGHAQWGFSGGRALRSEGYIDKYKNPVRTERGSTRKLRGNVVVPTADFNRTMDLCDDLVGVPAMWVLDEKSGDYRSLDLYGDFEDITANADNGVDTMFQLELNGYQ